SIDSFTCNLEGELPEFDMIVTNVGYILQDYMRDQDGLSGGTVSFVMVNTGLLAVDYSNDTVTLRIGSAINRWPDVALTLGVPSALRGRIPENRHTPHSCPHRFRKCRCSYTGDDIDSINLPSGTPVEVTTATGYSSANITGIEYYEAISDWDDWVEYAGNPVAYNPIHITVPDHGFVTGITVTVAGVTELTPTINGDHRIRVVDDDTFQLCDTDGADYTGAWSADGTVETAWGGHGLVTGDAATITTETDLTPSLNGNYVVTRVDDVTVTLDGTDGDDYADSYDSGAKIGFRYCTRTPADCKARGLYPHRFGGPIGLRHNMVRYA
ncbi:MAG TPA: hypothetical protein VMW52_09960, partial [Phycisphaerae bacterium]|nr:hypothetical protein [Phycisphaerae bacterium]